MSTAQEARLPGLSAGKVWWICTQCCATKQVSERYQGSSWLRCAGECVGTTIHELVGRGQDYRERANREQDHGLQALAATEQMLDALGIRLRRLENQKRPLSVEVHVGPGWTDRFIIMDARLSFDDQARCLREAWQCLLPLNEAIWCDDSRWHDHPKDPRVRWMGLGWAEVPRG